MAFYRRRLPHWIPDQAVVFVTWRLAGSMPPSRPETLTADNTGRSFCQRDEQLDRLASGGPVWLQDPRIAGVVSDALRHGETVRGLYRLHAWVIMPNHVHVIMEPRAALADIMRWLKGRTSGVANRILGITGRAFWQDESFDRWIRSRDELLELTRYVEENPVKAGLVALREEWLWTSARVRADDEKRSSAQDEKAVVEAG